MRRPVPTVRAVVLAVIGVVLLVAARRLGRPDLAGFGAAALLLPLLTWVASLWWARRPGPRGEISRTVHGDPVPHATLDITVQRAGGPPGEGHEVLPSDGPAAAVGTTAGGELVYRFIPPRRGMYRLGPFIATATDPLHLVRHQRAADAGTLLAVGPPPAAGRPGRAARELLTIAVPGGAEPDTTVRPFHEGDPFRRIHWPLSARQGQLMVRPDVQGHGGDPLVLLDRHPGHYRGRLTWVAHEDGTGRRSTQDFDAAVADAASALAALRERGRPVTLTAFPAAPSGDEASVLARLRPATHGAPPPSGSSGGLLILTGTPGPEAAAWPRSRSERTALVVLHAPPGTEPDPEAAMAWARAGWRWTLEPVGTDRA